MCQLHRKGDKRFHKEESNEQKKKREGRRKKVEIRSKFLSWKIKKVLGKLNMRKGKNCWGGTVRPEGMLQERKK